MKGALFPPAWFDPEHHSTFDDAWNDPPPWYDQPLPSTVDPQLRVSVDAAKVMLEGKHPPVLTVRCDACQSALARLWRTHRGLLFVAELPGSPKDLNKSLLAGKGEAKVTGAKWQRSGTLGRVVDLLDEDLGPHPELKVKCRRHGAVVVSPDVVRRLVRSRRKVMPIRGGAVLSGRVPPQ